MKLHAAKQYLIDRFPESNSAPVLLSIDRFVNDGLIENKTWGQLKYDFGKIWKSEHNSSIHRHVHSWLFMNEWINHIHLDRKILDIVMGVVLDWSALFLLTEEGDPFYRYAYHDEATAQRLRIAIKLHHHLISAGHSTEETVGHVESILDHTASKLESTAFYAGLNNHGMFQSLALRDYSVYADWLELDRRTILLDLANKRLNDYFVRSFTVEGVHVEHSPSYHLMVLRHVSEHRDFLCTLTGTRSEFLDHLLENAERHSIHTILPDGNFLPVSDTRQIALSSPKNNVFNSEYFKFASTSGKQGVEPKEITLYEQNSGYFIHRSSWKATNVNYLAFIAAYNAHYHKHSDDLHVYLWSNGNEILSESGPYGYDGSNPLVRLGFSQWSHNNIVIDGRSLRRSDGQFDKVSMLRRIPTLDGWQIEAQNRRFDSVIHTRKITLVNSLDCISVEDSLDANFEHKYTLNWNFGPKVKLTFEDNVIYGSINKSLVLIMRFESGRRFDVVHRRGVGGSTPRGWRFPSMNKKVPASLVSVNFSGAASKITTSIRLLSGNESDSEREYIIKSMTVLRKVRPRSEESKISDKSLNEIIVHHIASSFVDKLDSNNIVLDDSYRAVIKLFNQQGLVKTNSGRVSTMRWPKVLPGTYRARIYPKGSGKSAKPFTTPWFKI